MRENVAARYPEIQKSNGRGFAERSERYILNRCRPDVGALPARQRLRVQTRWCGRRTLTAPGIAFTVAAGFLIVEAVLVGLLKQVDPEDPVGIVYAVLMGVALVGNFMAGIAAAAAASADRRREAELSSELAHMVLRAGDLQSAANEAGRHLAAALNLRFVSVELTEAAGDHRPGAIPLRDATT